MDEKYPPKLLEVTTTVPSEQIALEIAAQLVEHKLAACVQVAGPITSVYRWQGAVEQSSEYRTLAKTTSVAYAQVAAKIRDLHPYDVPEILAVEVDAADDAYWKWATQQVESAT